MTEIPVSPPPPGYDIVFSLPTRKYVHPRAMAAFVEQLGTDPYISGHRLATIFLSSTVTPRWNDRTTSYFYNIDGQAKELSTYEKRQLIRSRFSKVCIHYGTTYIMKHVHGSYTFRDVVSDIPLEDTHQWIIMSAETSRRSPTSFNEMSRFTMDDTMTLDSTIPGCTDDTIFVLCAVPRAEKYCLCKLNESIHPQLTLRPWVITPAPSDFNRSRAIFDDVIGPMFFTSTEGLDVSYFSFHTGNDTDTLTKANYYVRPQQGTDASSISGVDFSTDTSGLFTKEELYNAAIQHASSDMSLLEATSLCNSSFAQFMYDAMYSKDSYQVYRVWIADDAEVHIDFLVNKEKIQSMRTSIVPFHGHVYTFNTSISDETLQDVFRLRMLVPGLESHQTITSSTYNMILKNLSNRDVVQDIPMSEDVTRSIRCVNTMDTLYEYQKENVRWMIRQEHVPDGIVGLLATRVTGDPEGPGVFRCAFPQFKYSYVANPENVFTRGGFLCDDVGMGKTRQAIELVRATTTSESRSTLIIVPPNIIDQWRREVSSVWPDCRLAVVHGRFKKNVDMAHVATHYDIVVATTRTSEQLTRVGWERVMVDESHLNASRTSWFESPKKWLITATPYTNLNKQMEWLVGSSYKCYDSVSYNHRSTSYYYNTHQGPENMLLEYKYLVLKLLMTRKTRDVHAMLPDVSVARRLVLLHENERSHYQATIQACTENRLGMSYISTMMASSHLVGVSTFGPRFVPDVQQYEQTSSTHFHPDRTLLPEQIPEDTTCPICISSVDTDASRTACNHWFCTECINLHLTSARHQSTCPMCRHIIQRHSVERTIVQDGDVTAVQDSAFLSTKMIQILTDLQRALDDDKHVLLFVHQKSHLDIVTEILSSKSIAHMTLHGAMNVERRNRIFSDFQEGLKPASKVLVLTTKCASAGITLTTADVIMVLSPCDDASTEEQIIGRSRRIGRPPEKSIEFISYVSNDTIESSIDTERDRYRLANVWSITKRLIS